MNRILLQTDDAHASRDEATAKGAHVSQILGRRLVEIMVPPGFDETTLTTTRAPDVASLDPDETLFHQAWHLAPAPEQPRATPNPPPCAGPSDPPGLPATEGSALPKGFGATLTGLVAIKIFMTELTVTRADGQTETFSTKAQLIATLSQVIKDNAMVVGWNPFMSGLTFALSVESPAVSLTAQQTITAADFAVATLAAYDLKFRSQDLLEYLVAFADVSRAKGAGMIFVTSSPFLSGTRGNAYLQSFVAVVSLATPGAPPGTPPGPLAPQLYAHEMLHLFGASDEYCNEGGTDCDYGASGLYEIPNCNCCATEGRPFYCGTAPQTACIMASGLQAAMCGWTGQQLGWSRWMLVGSNRTMAQVSAGVDGSLWGVDGRMDIWRSPSPAFCEDVVWQAGPAGLLTQIYAYDATLAFGLDMNGKSYQVTPTACDGLTEQTFSCLAVTLAGSQPSVVGLNKSDGTLWSWAEDEWIESPISGRFTQVVCASKTGQLWMVGLDSRVYTAPNANGPLTLLSSQAMVLTRIGVSPDGDHLYGLNAGYQPQRVLYWNGTGWFPTEGYVPALSIGGAQGSAGVPAVWGQNGESLYRRYILTAP